MKTIKHKNEQKTLIYWVLENLWMIYECKFSNMQLREYISSINQLFFMENVIIKLIYRSIDRK